MYLRFEIADLDERTGQPTGLLTLAYRLLRRDDIVAAVQDEIRTHVAWLEKHLPEPDRFARKRNVSHKNTHGVSWLRSDATEAIARMRAITAIADQLGYRIEVVRTTRPGYVVHEDAYQVVCEPFHGEGR